MCFSGDKLLGGPQAGILAGRADLIDRLRRHPLQRALRADKLTLAALEGTLALALDPERARREIPVLRMLAEPVAAVRERAERLAVLVGGEVEETVARVGGGALPLAELPSFACAIEEALFDPLRAGEPPVVGIVRDGRLLLDVRALGDGEIDEVAPPSPPRARPASAQCLTGDARAVRGGLERSWAQADSRTRRPTSELARPTSRTTGADGRHRRAHRPR